MQLMKKSVSCSVERSIASSSNCICACDYDDEDERRHSSVKQKSSTGFLEVSSIYLVLQISKGLSVTEELA